MRIRYTSPLNARRPLPLPLIALLLVALALATLPAPAQAAVWKLSRLGPVDGRVRTMAVAGERLIFQADFAEEGLVDLFSMPIAGGAQVRLNTQAPPGQVLAFQVSADGAWVIFTLKRYSDGLISLYSVPAAGGAATQLNNPDDGQEIQFWFAGAGRAVFRSGGVSLYSVPIRGGTPVALSPAPPTGRSQQIDEVQISADGALVAYTLKRDGQTHLYTIPAIGGTPLQVSDTPVGANYTSLRFVLSADGARLAYLTPTPDPADSSEHGLLVSVNADGSDRRELASGSWLLFELHNRSGRLIYSTTEGELAKVRSIPIGGGATGAIADALPVLYAAPWLALNPYSDDGFLMGTVGGGVYRFPIDGGEPAKVSDAANVNPFQFFFTPDGQRALFADNDVSGGRLYAYALAGGAPRRVDDPAVSGEKMLDFWLTPGGDRVIYTANTATSGLMMGLFSTPVGGGAVVKISGPPSATENFIAWPVFSPDGAVIYATGTRELGGSNQNTRYAQIYRAPAAGGSPPVQLARSQAIVGDVLRFQVSPIDRRVLYVADQEVDGDYELFSVPMAGGEMVKLSSQPEAGIIRPTGGEVLVFGVDPADQAPTLSVVPIGGGVPRLLYRAPTAGYFFSRVVFAPNGRNVIFTLRGPNGEKPLFRIPLTGGEPTPLGAADTFEITPNSARAVAIRDGGPGYQIGSTPISGLNWLQFGLIASTRDYRISPDGAYVVFRSIDWIQQDLGLASSRIAYAGSTTITTDPIHTFQIAPNSAQVVYVARVGGQYQLYSAPIAGGGTPVPLAGPSESPPAFAVAPTSDRVVYLTSRPGSSDYLRAYTLSSVPIGGGAPTVLVDAYETGLQGLTFTISPDGGRVLYQPGYELWSIAITGGEAANLLTGELATEISFAEDGRVVMLASRGRLLINRLTGGALRQLSPWPERVDSFKLIGAQVVYRAIDGGNVQNLYTADLLDALDLGERVHLPLMGR